MTTEIGKNRVQIPNRWREKGKYIIRVKITQTYLHIYIYTLATSSGFIKIAERNAAPAADRVRSAKPNLPSEEAISWRIRVRETEASIPSPITIDLDIALLHSSSMYSEMIRFFKPSSSSIPPFSELRPNLE